MTAITATRTQFPTGLVLLGLLIFAGIGIALAADTLSAHAIARHGETALQVHDCLTTGKPVMHLVNPTTGREAFVVCLPDGRHGVQIDEPTGENVTAYKLRYKFLTLVLDYLIGGGWTVVGGLLAFIISAGMIKILLALLKG